MNKYKKAENLIIKYGLEDDFNYILHVMHHNNTLKQEKNAFSWGHSVLYRKFHFLMDRNRMLKKYIRRIWLRYNTILNLTDANQKYIIRRHEQQKDYNSN